MATALIILGGVIFVADVATTVLLVRARMYSPQQKTLQVILVWLVPVVGCLLSLYFLFESRTVAPFKDSPPSDLGDAWTLSQGSGQGSGSNYHGH